MATLDINRVRKSYGSMEVLKEVNISIEDGEFLVLLGPSGCGKSTLLNIIAGLEDITGGDVLIGNRVVNDLPPKDRDIAMVFQSYALYPTMTVRQNIEFGMKIRGISAEERAKATKAAAEMLQMTGLLDRKPSQLSGGQRQRVAMGRAIVRHPELFLFDEPLSNLDAKLRVDMRTEIKRLHQRLGATIVYVTHDQIEAMTLATKVAVMKDGIVQHFGTPQEVYDRPANTYVARFVGSPAMNILRGRLVASDGPVTVAFETSDGEALVSGVPLSPESAARFRDREVLVGIRPEHFTMDTAGAVPLTVDMVEPTGPDTLVVFSAGGADVVARLDPLAISVGTKARFGVKAEKIVLFDPETETRLD
ncbi:sn-glycerol-3-phosphate ABC transporter ATP-binding protein UgpC [Yangia mangrovi]|uniref:Sn-glycerol-3-phosphate ABC transporter ATP-binding protein UgpC n=1 Tax=Alloyangia mangrovi TaxID=1779329 RepID=A0A2A3K287_9RHOB|nr:sn-glycerol-3-phosphate ABC transporter ATP-binding protein UgpC [Alloyangia mangrovi]MCT4371583.1 sn-glycerol-3-phosphate ABC transporter ATP-binding protein UgpC [Alloyangia mangrovi]